MTEAKRNLAAALGRIPSGMFILTARQGADETGMLASWVQQCSFDPPLVTVAIKHGRAVAGWLEATPFILNLLDESQTDMVAHFGRGFEPGEPAFHGLEVERSGSRPPILKEALAFIECQVVSRHPAGDHDLFVCQVIAGQMLNDGKPMVHVRKSGMHY